MPSCTGRTPTRVNFSIPSHPRITPSRTARIARSISLDLEDVSKSNLLAQRKLSSSGAISQRHLGQATLISGRQDGNHLDDSTTSVTERDFSSSR